MESYNHRIFWENEIKKGEEVEQMGIDRQLTTAIKQRMFKGKAIIILGPRQSGKTTLSENLLEGREAETLYLNGDEADVRADLANATSAKLRTLIGTKKILFIDEAQRVPDVGIAMKLVTDQIKNVQVIATGSSALEIAAKTSESLTGRKYEYFLYPLSFAEMVQHHGLLEEKRLLDRRLIYGYYPEIVTTPGEEPGLLKLLTNSYLYKDLLMLNGIHKPVLLEHILQALAQLVGSEVSFSELAGKLQADRKTIERYIELLEKAFVVFQVHTLSRNPRNEILKGRKVYFYDNGVRNAIINTFNPPHSRVDMGSLWENFLMSERKKYLAFNGIHASMYFWRSTQQQELDYIETRGEGELFAFEFKWSKQAKAKFPKTFLERYTPTESRVVTPANYDEFLSTPTA
ncbi:MAG: ATP-binding protein [Candidatus Kapaibacterium sp.]|jgi:predicted AAA+ superfamily ATPase